MNRFIIVHKYPDSSPGYYFTGPVNSPKVLFKFKYNGQILEGYYKKDVGIYFTKELQIIDTLLPYPTPADHFSNFF